MHVCVGVYLPSSTNVISIAEVSKNCCDTNCASIQALPMETNEYKYAAVVPMATSTSIVADPCDSDACAAV